MPVLFAKPKHGPVMGSFPGIRGKASLGTGREKKSGDSTRCPLPVILPIPRRSGIRRISGIGRAHEPTRGLAPGACLSHCLKVSCRFPVNVSIRA